MIQDVEDKGSSGGGDSSAEMMERARRMRTQYVDLRKATLDREIGNLLPEAMARRYHMICIGKLEKKITVAMEDPLDVFAIDDVKIRTGFDVESVLADPEAIELALKDVYGEDTSWKEVVSQAEGVHVDVLTDDDEESEKDVVIDQPVIKLVNMIIQQAVDKKASDIHLEPREQDMLVRYRIDGVLHEIMTVPRSILPAVVSRLKIMARLRIDERRIPQDGRIHLSMQGRELDFRVSTLPTLNGETIVMRILDRKAMKVDLQQLGFADHDFNRWVELLEHPHGIILVTGPTGSGKSTTLYSSLAKINQPDVKILTIEDPVEYNLKGIVQVQTNPKVGLTFAAGLRSFLRQDPDVIMVGEIRDRETAQIAIEAALTGHLVLSTLHTNDAVSSVTRLVDMGIEPFLLASTMIGVIAQRLLRTNCKDCKQPAPLYPELLKIFMDHGIHESQINLSKGTGCVTCANTGYKGRMGIYELASISEEMREMILRRSSNAELLAAARKGGLLSLYEDGLMKVAQGVTTYEELMRVTAE
jgi:type IV pilus assembly protein PilB